MVGARMDQQSRSLPLGTCTALAYLLALSRFAQPAAGA